MSSTEQPGTGFLPIAARAKRRRSSLAGFTLIELLIAISLLAIVVTLTYAAMFQVTSGAKLLTDEFSEDQELRLLLRMVAQDLGAVQYLSGYVSATPTGGVKRGSGMILSKSFAGRSDFSVVDFHAAVRSRQNRQGSEGGDPGLHEIGYSVKEDFQSKAIQLIRREDFYIDDQMQLGGVTSPLAKGIEIFKIECLTPAANPQQTQEVWAEEWNSTTQPKGAELPSALRITLGIEGKNGRHLKETVEINLLGALGLK